MFREALAKAPRMRVLAAVSLAMGSACLAAAAGQAGVAASGPAATHPTCTQPVKFKRDAFPRRPVIDNRWFPLIPGTQLTLEGRANRGGGPLPHTVRFTVTDLTKVINGVRTRVVWDVDLDEGELAERELAFFAQDRDGNVWNLGEYPEEFEDGAFIGAPSTWLAGVAGAEAGLHMVNRPRVGQSWLQGIALDIDFLDCARVFTVRHQVCVPFKCYSPYLRTHERSPLDVEGGIQTKDHAPGVGIVQVGALNDPEGETLVLTDATRLGPDALTVARSEALKLDARGYAVSEVYGHSPPAKAPPGAQVLPDTGPDQSTGGLGTPGGSSGSPGAAGPPPDRSSRPGASPGRARRYTAKVDHPLVPLTTIRRTVFEGREGDAKLRVVSTVLERTTRVAGVRVAIVKVRDFEDGELVERTADYYAQDRRGRVWYFGERVDDIENGKVVGHEGQWLAGKNGARPGVFMPAKPRVGQVFEQERAPGVARDRSKIMAAGLDVRTPAGQFHDCLKTRDYAPLDRATESKFYCAGVGLVREKPADGRLDLVRYRSIGG
jgi:hypothetical protein